MTYRPIDCSLHDHLESIATLRKPARITYQAGDGRVADVEDRIVDIITRDGIELIKLAGGAEIRLDDLHCVDDVNFRPEQDDPQRVVFVCEFGSKKSVLAAAWFAKLAAERGMSVESTSRGITPDAEVPARVRDALRTDAIDISDAAPRALAARDWENSDIVVSFTEQPLAGPGNATVQSWADVPALSDDFDVAYEQIITRVRALVDELSRAAKQ